MASINSADTSVTVLRGVRAAGPIGKLAPSPFDHARPEALLAYLYVYPEQNGAFDQLIDLTRN